MSMDADHLVLCPDMPLTVSIQEAVSIFHCNLLD